MPKDYGTDTEFTRLLTDIFSGNKRYSDEVINAALDAVDEALSMTSEGALSIGRLGAHFFERAGFKAEPPVQLDLFAFPLPEESL